MKTKHFEEYLIQRNEETNLKVIVDFETLSKAAVFSEEIIFEVLRDILPSKKITILLTDPGFPNDTKIGSASAYDITCDDKKCIIKHYVISSLKKNGAFKYKEKENYSVVIDILYCLEEIDDFRFKFIDKHKLGTSKQIAKFTTKGIFSILFDLKREKPKTEVISNEDITLTNTSRSDSNKGDITYFINHAFNSIAEEPHMSIRERSEKESGIRQRYHARSGHWRRHKSGKKIWVNSYCAGDKSLGRVDKVIRIV